MANKVNVDVLQQHWMHSHEEDTDTEMVFRPASYSFPRSRGRRSFELRPDGRLVQAAIGPTDRPLESEGSWKLEDDDRLAFYSGSQSEPTRVLRIARADRDRLVVKK